MGVMAQMPDSGDAIVDVSSEPEEGSEDVAGAKTSAVASLAAGVSEWFVQYLEYVLLGRLTCIVDKALTWHMHKFTESASSGWIKDLFGISGTLARLRIRPRCVHPPFETYRSPLM